MPKKENKLIQRINAYINALISPSTQKSGTAILFWREKIFLAIVLSALILGILAFIPGIFAFTKMQMWGMLGLNISVYVILGLLFLAKRKAFKFRLYTLFLSFYIFGTILLLYLGIKGPGLIWMFVFPILGGMLSSFRVTIFCLCLNLITLLIITVIKYYNLLQNFPLHNISMDEWSYVVSSFIAINSIIALSLTILVNGLEATLNKEKRYKELLNEKQQKLTIAKEKAEEADRLKTSFLANMSYEIRTPMNAIIGFSDLLANPNISYAQREKYVNIIKSNGLDLVELIDDIIELAMLDAKQVKLIKKNIYLNQLLDELLEQYTDEISKTGKSTTKIKTSKAIENNDFTITTDKARLTQVLKILINNAIKTTPKGIVEFGYAIENYKETKYLKLYVKDNGKGISEEKQKEIFERFVKLDTMDKKMSKESGLGLNISYKLVELLGGTLSLHSTAGEGTIFFFTINYELPSQFN